MQKLSKFEYEEVSKPSGRANSLKISWVHQFLLRMESLMSIRNLFLLCLTIVFSIFCVYPYGKYVVIKFDKRYFGVFYDRLPRLALTTMQKKYFSENNIPFQTIDDVKNEREEFRIREEMGI
jgi:TM2 domain-containing membrane protein YozV